MIQVAWGVPERSVSEAQLLAVLRSVSVNFDEAPKRMHAVLGPPGHGVRWFTFACSVFARDQVLAEDHFTETIEGDLAELIVVARSRWSERPERFELRGNAERLRLIESGGKITVHGTLAPTAKRDGDVDEIGLRAIGLAPAPRPFAVLAAPTHQVMLRVDQARPSKLAITKLAGPVLPCRVNDAQRFASSPSESFPRTDRAVDPSDPAQLAEALARLSKEAEEMYSQRFDPQEGKYIAKLASFGDAIVPLLVKQLEQPKARPRTSRLCIGALGALKARPDVVFAWVNRGTSLAEAAYAALATMGEVARPVYVEKTASKKAAERIAAESMLRFLDDPRYADLRAVQAARAAMTKEARASIASSMVESDLFWSGLPLKERLHVMFGRTGAISYAMQHARTELRGNVATIAKMSPDAMWPLALFMVENALPGFLRNKDLVDAAAEAFGPSFQPVADVLLSLPTFEDDATLQAIAAGKKPPTTSELVDASREASKKAKAKKAKAKPKAKPKAKKK